MKNPQTEKFSVAPVVGATLVNTIASCLLAQLYTYAILHISNPYLRGTSSLVFGTACGVLAGWALTQSNVRKSSFAILAGGATGLAALYTSWGVWLHNVLANLGVNITASHMLSAPASMWDMAGIVNAIGTWSMERGVRSRGNELWFAWSLELVAVFAAAVLGSMLVTGSIPLGIKKISTSKQSKSMAGLQQPVAV